MYSPDEKQSIRNEQNRDAGIPSEAEMRRAKTCDECGEEDESVRHRTTWYEPACPARQSPVDAPDFEPPRLCDDCFEGTPTTDDVVEQCFHEGDDLVVVYGCGVVRGVDRQTQYNEAHPDATHPPHPNWRAEATLRCACGEPIDEVRTRENRE